MGFLAPEVLGGGDVDERADLFAVGRTLEALFEIAEGAVPKDVRALARRLVAHERAARPTSAAEVLELLDAVVPPVPGRSLREVRSVQPERLVGRERELAVIEELVTGLRAAEPGPRPASRF